MDNFQENVKNDRNWIEKITQYVPLYKGYKEKEIRRESDEYLRKYILEILTQFRTEIKNLLVRFTNEGKIDLLDDVDNLLKRSETILDKIRHTTYGYSGFFDIIKIHETEIDLLYYHDKKIVELSKEITQEIKNVMAQINDTNVFEKINEITGIINKLDALVNDRARIIMETKEIG